MEWIHILFIIVTILGTGYYIRRNIKNEIKIQSDRMDKMYETFTIRTNAFIVDSDRLYNMFIDLLKEKK